MILAWHAFDFIKEYFNKYPGNYLEIGVYEGEAIANLGQLFNDRFIYAIDPFIEDSFTSWLSKVGHHERLSVQYGKTINNINGLNNVKLFVQKSEEFFEQLTDDKIKEYNIDKIFIDGDHHYESVKSDYYLALRLLNGKSGFIVFDDTNLEGVQQLLDEIRFPNHETIIIEPNCEVFFINE